MTNSDRFTAYFVVITLILIAANYTFAQTSTLEYEVKQSKTTIAKRYATTLQFSSSFTQKQIGEIKVGLAEVDAELWTQCKDPFIYVKGARVDLTGKIVYTSFYNNGHYSTSDYHVVAEVVQAVLGKNRLVLSGPPTRDPLSRQRLAPAPAC